MCIPIICSVRAIFSMLSAAKKAWRACPIGWMRQDKTTGTVKPVPVFYAVLCVGRILSLSRTSFYDSVCCFVFFFAVVTEAISFLLITLQFSEIHIARDSKHTVSTCISNENISPQNHIRYALCSTLPQNFNHLKQYKFYATWYCFKKSIKHCGVSA